MTTKTKTRPKKAKTKALRNTRAGLLAERFPDDALEPEAPEPVCPHNLRVDVMRELAKRARRLEEKGYAHAGGDVRSLSNFYDALADTFGYEDDLNLPASADPLVLAETFYLPGESTEHYYVIAVKRIRTKEGWRLAPVWAELKDYFRPL